jgi:hypothetical protein
MEKTERSIQERGPEAIRTTVIIQTVADPLGVYKEYAYGKETPQHAPC